MSTSMRLAVRLLTVVGVLLATGCHPLAPTAPAGSPPVAGSGDSVIATAPGIVVTPAYRPSVTIRATRAVEPVILNSGLLTTTEHVTDTALAAFVWSYRQLLDVWNPATGLTQDKGEVASGKFDAIQATGSLAAATAQAAQLGVISHEDAVQIVTRIGHALLVETPRYHGLWPHFVTVSPQGDIAIAPGTEWSSVDTAIAAIGLLTAQHGLGLDTYATEQMLRAVDWADLAGGPGGMISHGYAAAGERLPGAWDVFGTESWLVALAYAAATGRVAPIAYPSPPTANGSGFIDELAWLFILPPSEPDAWGTDWPAYRSAAVNRQISYYPANQLASCFARAGLFGLSAAEAPDPAQVSPGSVYQAFGVGGRFEPANDGVAALAAPVVTPHYAAMIAALRPLEATAMWGWLIAHGFFGPDVNAESLMFPAGSSCEPAAVVWNQGVRSWNLALQTLGWGRYLAQRRGLDPILWQATTENALLRDGYRLLAPNEAFWTPAPTWSLSRECEERNEHTVGQTVERPSASGFKVHGQFGTLSAPPWSPQAGQVRYGGLALPQTDHLYLRLRYAKFSPPAVPIQIYLDDEPAPRASRYLVGQGSWDSFAWTEPILLGSVISGTHTLTFATAGQTYGVADLDLFILADEPPAAPAAPTPAGR